MCENQNELQGVTVAGYRTDEFPAFFTRSSGCEAPCRINTPEEAASLYKAAQHLALGSGVLIGESLSSQPLNATMLL